MTEFSKVRLSTGVTLNVALAGPTESPAVILLHGFPESHRTWREIEPRLGARFRLIMPDQRGFGGSDKPVKVSAYKTDRLIDDIFALVDALRLERFALVGHDFGGAIAWGAALRRDPRLSRLAIINAPHPVIFQKSLIADAGQRKASQYITAFRAPGFVKFVEWKGFEWFFDKAFGRLVDRTLIPEAERQQYIAGWSQPGAFAAMLNWYRASPVRVPLPGITVRIPDWVLKPFPKVRVPALVVWGMRDQALLPVQLEGLDQLVEQLTVKLIANAGHFAPWEAPDAVAAVLAPFLDSERVATAPPR